MAEKTFTVYRTHHGPVVREENGKLIAVRLMEEPLKALIQSFSRTKARNIAEYKQVMEAHTNSSNDTLYADADGNIAYFHSNFVPKRNPKLDWTKPVDGSVPANDWQGVHAVDDSPSVENPPNGWVYNTNNWPYTAAGPYSKKKSDFPAYFDRNGENPRGVHALRVLPGKKDFTLDSLTATVFDSQQPEFETQVPLLVRAWDQAPASNPLKAKLKDPIELLRKWDHRWAADSVPQSLAYFWGEELWSKSAAAARDAGVSVYDYMRTKATPQQRLEALAAVTDKLAADFGKWATPWGEINRFQRISPAIVHPFDDSPAEHAGRLHLGALGIAGLVRRPQLQRQQEDLRHQRQQLRGRGGVRQGRRAGQGGDRRRAEQRCHLEALQRPGRALRHRQPARGLLLPEAARRSHREDL